jgi:hypothetical protein
MYIYREKNGIVRNDFLDSMMALRNTGKEDLQQNSLSAKNATKDATFGKLTDACRMVRTNVITERDIRRPDESGLKIRCTDKIFTRIPPY